jgi:ornithine cyclodeaminase
MKVTILTEGELRQLVTIDQEVVDAIEEAFTWLATDKVAMPPIMHISIPENSGDVDIKAAYVQGLESFAVKMGAGFFNNHQLGLPNSPAMMVVLSATTGFAEAVMLDNAYLTDVRTGAAGAVAAKHLARSDIETAGVIGTGTQGRYQMMGLNVVRNPKRVLAYDQNAERLDAYVREMEAVLQVDVVAAPNAATVIEESDAVVTSTPSRRPYLQPEWLHAGLHITAMGADLPAKQELMPGVLGEADLLVCDRKSQCFTMGELHHGLNAGLLTEDAPITELGEITAGRKPGRQNDRQITLCDLTGTGVQDTAIARLALQRAAAIGLGVEIDIGYD